MKNRLQYLNKIIAIVLLAFICSIAAMAKVTTVATGYRTLSKAVGAASSGDTLLLVSGSYDEYSSTAAYEIAVTKTLTIKASETATTKPKVTTRRFVLGAADISLSLIGLEILGTSTGYEFIDFSAAYNVKNIKVKDCIVHKYDRGIRMGRYANTADSIIVSGVTWYEEATSTVTYAAIGVDGSSKPTVKGITVKNSTFYNIGASVISVANATTLGDSTRILVDHNTFYNCVSSSSKSLVSLPSTKTCTVRMNFSNNIVTKVLDPTAAKPFSITGGKVYFTNNSITNFATAAATPTYCLNNFSRIIQKTDTVFASGNDTITIPEFVNISSGVFALSTSSTLFRTMANGGPVGDQQYYVGSITFTNAQIVGEAAASVTVGPSTALNKKLQWSVSPEDALKVSIDSETGYISTTNTCSVAVTATSTDGVEFSASKVIEVVYLPVSQIKVVGQTKTTAGNSLTYSVSVTPSNASLRDIVWSLRTQDYAYASLSQDGVLVAKKDGTVQVKASSVDGSGVADSLFVKIENVPVQGISISGSSAVAVSSTIKLTPVFDPEDAVNQNVIWSLRTEDARFAHIDTLGVLTGDSAGDVVVTVVSKENAAMTSSRTINVFNVPVSTISISGSTDVIVRDTLRLTATVSPINATYPTLNWSIEPTDGSMGSIDSVGTFVAGSVVGDVIIVATATDGSEVSGIYTIHVQPKLATSITISGPTTVTTDKVIQLTNTITPSDVTDPSVRWQIESGAQYAKIDIYTGGITGVAAGDIVVKVLSLDGSGVCATTTISVMPQLVTKIVVAGDSMLSPDSQVSYTASVYPSNAVNKTIKWAVREDDVDVASIDSITGVLTTLNPGVAIVKAWATDGSGEVGMRLVYISGRTGIKSLGASSISVYPQPVGDELTIRANETVRKVQVLNFSGAVLSETLNSTTVDVSNLSAGIYFVKIWTLGAYKPEIQKIIKK